MFFTYFNQIMSPGVDYNLTISRTATGDLVVILLPKARDLKDSAQHKIGPLKISGSADELDSQFFSQITAPIPKTSDILVDMAEYERQQDAAKAESKATKSQKEKLAKEAKNGQGSLFEAPAPSLQPATTPAPTPQVPTNHSAGGSFWPEMESAVCRGNEYEEIVDFPSEMLPPTYSGGVTAGAM